MYILINSHSRRDEVTGEWRRLHNEELNDLYSSPNMIKSRRMRWAGHVARIGEARGVYSALVGKPVGKRPLGSVIRCESSVTRKKREKDGISTPPLSTVRCRPYSSSLF